MNRMVFKRRNRAMFNTPSFFSCCQGRQKNHVCLAMTPCLAAYVTAILVVITNGQMKDAPEGMGEGLIRGEGMLYEARTE